MQFVDDHRFSLVLNSKSFPSQLSQWFEGKVTTFLPSPLVISTNTKYMVCLEEISFDFLPINLFKEQVSYWNTDFNVWDAFGITPNGNYSNTPSYLKVLNGCVPDELKNYLRFDFDVPTAKVEIILDITKVPKVQLSKKLAHILGFRSDIPYVETVNIGFRVADVYRSLDYLYLLCPNLVECTMVGTTLLPILHSLWVPKHELILSSRLCLSFAGQKPHWLPLRNTNLNRIEFQFVDAINLNPVRFDSNVDPCIVQLGFKEANLALFH